VESGSFFFLPGGGGNWDLCFVPCCCVRFWRRRLGG
jgi:hypothetical protein